MGLLDFSFKSQEQEIFFWSQFRNNCFSGGFGNGKSYIGCLRQFVNLATFPNYRSLIARENYKILKETTMRTFFKICPPDFVDTHNPQDGLTVLKNGSQVLWLHLDAFDEKSLKGLEINSALIDQAEESKEAIYWILNSRIGRWEKAEVPEDLRNSYFKTTGNQWPIGTRGEYRVPNFLDILCNPDTTFHWIYRLFHPDSLERNKKYFFINAPTNPDLNDPDTVAEMKGRDEEWVAKYFNGEWGASKAQIHNIHRLSYIEYDEQFVKRILDEAALYRVLDHGESSPTCCSWVGVFKNVYVFFREYYMPNAVVSTHRRNIVDLSGTEIYAGDYADPSIFDKTKRDGAMLWSIADEYKDSDLPGPPLFWMPANNNEFATRNRINELLALSPRFKHPITGECPAPGIYFVRKCVEYPYGCQKIIIETNSQRRVLIGSENGRSVYSDERDDDVSDHAYDTLRYFISMHGVEPKKARKEPPKRSFEYYNRLIKFSRT